jgi:hypothetical protein
MKINEIIVESGTTKMKPDQWAAMKSVSTFPDMNMNAGSQYLNYRFGLALAGAPDYPTKADTYIAGDPLLAPYTKEESAMIDYASQQVGGGKRETWTNDRSVEPLDVNKKSTVAPKKKNKYGV